MADQLMSDGDDDDRCETPDSLFDSNSDESHENEATPSKVYTLTAPRNTIPGLYHLPYLLSPHTESKVLSQIQAHGYIDASRGKNQAMLFGRWSASRNAGGGDGGKGASGLPPWADELVDVLAREVRIREEELGGGSGGVWELLFRPGEGGPSPLLPATNTSVNEDSNSHSHSDSPTTPTSRQMIINHYTPPEGISAHVDLPTRFDDGIMILSMESGIGMEFTRDDHDGDDGDESPTRTGTPTRTRIEQVHLYLYLPPLSCVILSGEARWKWKHGICESVGDWVTGRGVDLERDDWVMTQYTDKKKIADGHGDGREEQWAYYVPRQARTSVTIRWLMRGGDIVGT